MSKKVKWREDENGTISNLKKVGKTDVKFIIAQDPSNYCNGVQVLDEDDAFARWKTMNEMSPEESYLFEHHYPDGTFERLGINKNIFKSIPEELERKLPPPIAVWVSDQNKRSRII